MPVSIKTLTQTYLVLEAVTRQLTATGTPASGDHLAQPALHTCDVDTYMQTTFIHIKYFTFLKE